MGTRSGGCPGHHRRPRLHVAGGRRGPSAARGGDQAPLLNPSKGSLRMPKTLVVVESPAKAKTIEKYLGGDYTVRASYGHIRDLPKSQLGVDVEHDSEPAYMVPEESERHVRELKSAHKKADDLVLATDYDREGEAIAFHVATTLGV